MGETETLIGLLKAPAVIIVVMLAFIAAKAYLLRGLVLQAILALAFAGLVIWWALR